MDIKNFFSGLFPAKSRDVLHTPYGDFNLAKDNDRKRVQKMVIELQRTTDALTRKDIADWRMAWQLAINVDSPNRQRLYDIYRDVEVDLHLSGCVEQRRGFVMAKSFKIVDAKGDENEDAKHYFDQSWFKQLLRYALEANFWGHSLIELGDLATDGDGCICYSDVKLLPRKHVIPEYGRVITDLGQDWTTGICYREQPFADWLIEAGRPDDLGLYLKAATQTIPKKNMLAFWDTFGEIFGMPMRIARTTSRDKKEIDRLDRMLREAGASLSMVAGQDTEIEFVESGKGDAYNVYDKRIDRANSELSKLVIGQTMTIEDGSSLSQSETHLEVFQNLVDSDCDMLRDIVNNQLIPRMVRHGFPIKGLRFEWDYAVDYTPEQQKAYEEMILQHYKVNPQYFEDKYGMPCEEKPEPTEQREQSGSPELPSRDGGRQSQSAIMPGTGNNADDDQQQNDKKGKQHNAHSRFFD